MLSRTALASAAGTATASKTATPRLEPRNDFARFEKADIHQGIHERFESQAAKYAHRIAITDPERSLVYEAVNNAANNVSRAILEKCGRGDGQVAFVLQNDAYAIISLLGSLKAGKSYVPLDPSFPKDRIAFMLENSEASLILTDHAHLALAQQLSDRALPILLLDEIDLNRPSENPGLDCQPESLAYILYTSGSTGRPKGIAFSHRNLLHTTMCLTNNLHVSADDRLTQLHSTSFAASVVDIYCSLLNGASLYPWDVKMRGMNGLAKWLNEQQVTSIQWIPTPFRRLLEPVEREHTFESVRLVVMASEPLTRREFDLYLQHFPAGCLLVNQMGTSESYNYHLYFLNKDTIFEGSNVPAGYPVSEERAVLLLNENRAEVAPGQTGEIAIRSRYMSLGYWKDPELTARTFLNDPETGERTVYLTGDLGKKTEDGCLVHMGRKDWQVKIRGYRIELAEVECALKQMPGVRDVAAVARPDHKNELKLLAYCITDGNPLPSVTAIRQHLSSKLPDYMIPQIFVRVPEFPMTPSGKIEKNALPAPDATRPILGHEMVPPATELEETLSNIWQEVLGLAEVGVTDSFFELGGDSLQAALVVHLVGVRCGIDLGYSALLRAPKIADLAQEIERARVEARVGTIRRLDEGGSGRQGKERLLRGLANRVLQVAALYAPGLKSLRVWLHRLRGVHIGTNVAIGTAAILETAHPELVWVGNNVAIGIRSVVIAHFSDSINRERKDGGPTVRICDNVYIGPNVTILPNVTIGQGSVVTAGSVVNKSFPPGTMVQGNPARPVAHCGVPLVGEARSYEEFLRHLRVIEDTRP